MLKRIVATITIASIAMLIYLINTTTPTTIGPLGILFVFILIYLSVLGTVSYFIHGVLWVMNFATRESNSRVATKKISFRRAYYFASIIALAPVMLLGAQSIGRSSLYDIFLVLLFEVIALLYVSKRAG